VTWKAFLTSGEHMQVHAWIPGYADAVPIWKQAQNSAARRSGAKAARSRNEARRL
jgi:hypothetical protein